MIIDAHTHGIHGKYLESVISAGGSWATDLLAGLARIIKQKPQYSDVAFRLAQMEKCGIDSQVITQPILDSNLFPGDIPSQITVARAINDNMAHLQEDSKGKLIAVGSIPLSGFESEGRKELERAIKTLGLKAVNIPSNLMGKAIDLPEYEPFWAACAEMGVPVYIHPRHAVGHIDRNYEAEYDLMHNFGWPFETELMLARMVFSGMMEKYPTIKIVSHHLGGGIPFFLGRINETYNLNNQKRLIGKVLPKPVNDYFSLFYYDTAIGGSRSAIKCAYEVFGADKIIFATDSPYGPGDGESRLVDYPNIVRSIELSEVDNKKIFSDNARRILNLD